MAKPSGLSPVNKKLFVFDLDGTLAESKAALDAEMAALLKTLLGQVKVAVISGGDWPQFESQLLANPSPDANLKNLSLLPTCGTKFYQFDSGWQQLYADDFTLHRDVPSQRRRNQIQCREVIISEIVMINAAMKNKRPGHP